MDTADTTLKSLIISSIANLELQVTLITPGVAPGVLNQPIVQAAGLISAVTDNE